MCDYAVLSEEGSLNLHYAVIFIYGLFNNAVSSSDYKRQMIGLLINNELERTWKGTLVGPNLRYYP
jgi:hypothetical protein